MFWNFHPRVSAMTEYKLDLASAVYGNSFGVFGLFGFGCGFGFGSRFGDRRGTNRDDTIISFSPFDNTLDGRGGDDTIISFFGDDLLKGGRGDDTLIDYFGDNTQRGGRGDDLLIAGRGDDRQFGGRGDDTLKPGAGDNFVDGGEGEDTLVLETTIDDVDFDFSTFYEDGKVVITGGDAVNTAKNVELLKGSDGQIAALTFTLELLHFTDQEANAATIDNIDNLSAVLNALRMQDLGDDGVEDNTLTLSSGDVIIPGLFFDASEAVFGSAGIADIQIQNELGLQAAALGNHEFDLGTAVLAGLIDGSAPGDFSALTGTALDGQDFTGAAFPYLSSNLGFDTDANLAPLEVAGGQAPQGNVLTSSTVLETGGELIGVVGATTPTLDTISSPGDVSIFPADFDGTPTAAQLDALAAEIQAEVDALLAANPDMNKVILLAHMQQISIELALAERLEDVDVIIAGGSNTRLFDDNDRIRDGDSDQGQYPLFVENAGGTTTAVVNTDGNYKYVGRLVIDFDANGNIIAESYDEDVSGAYATDDQGVADLGAEGLIDPEIDAITDAIQAQIVATEGNVFGVSNVFLNGNRSGTGAADDPDGVRTQETNLGNLTADANLAVAQMFDSSVVASIKNGGGIRANIGQVIVPPGGSAAERLPNEEILDETGAVVKPEGGISQSDIATTLAFNNGLTLLTLSASELLAVLEHAVGDIGGGRFPQISGFEFSFDPNAAVGARIQSVALVDESGDAVTKIVENGEILASAPTEYRIVTLNFLAGGGDGYPFPSGASANRVDLYDQDVDGVADGLRTGDAVFADDGTEQDALAEFLFDNFATSETAFDEADTGPALDERIQNLAFRTDSVFDGFDDMA